MVVDINFRMDTSALYSDIVLPTASWYEKDDLNSTDMHSFIHPLQMAVPPSWESKSDWDIFKILAEKFSELAPTHFPEPVRDLVAMPLQHDTPAEMAQAHITVSAETSGDQEVRVEVSDEGIGIPQDHREMVFEPFRQVGEQFTSRGAGLGLAICKGLVEAHGGRIWIASKLGEGSSFYFTLPKERRSA